MINAGPNTILRALEPSDLTVLHQWENNSLLWHLSYGKQPLSKAVLRNYINAASSTLQEAGQLRLVVEHKGIPVGAVDLYDYDPVARKAGLGILIDTQNQQRGLGKEALKAMLTYAHEHLGLHQVYAHIPVSNAASIALFESTGFKIAGSLEDWLWNSGDFEAAHIYQYLLHG